MRRRGRHPGYLARLIDMNGPLLPLIWNAAAAEQRHRTGHSCIVQHFEMAGDSRTGLTRRS